MPIRAGRSITRTPAGVCDACGKGCCVRNHIGIRCYRCFKGVFINAALFYWMEIDGEQYAIPLPEVETAPAECFTVNVTDPPAEVIIERFERSYEERFGYRPWVPDTSASVPIARDLPRT